MVTRYKNSRINKLSITLYRLTDAQGLDMEVK